MATLRCGVNECAHNKENFCCNESIKVGGVNASIAAHTECESFDEKGNEINSLFSQSPNPSMAIGCSASNCIHNENQRCVSSYVDISSSASTYGNTTECLSFTKK